MCGTPSCAAVSTIHQTQTFRTLRTLSLSVHYLEFPLHFRVKVGGISIRRRGRSDALSYAVTILYPLLKREHKAQEFHQRAPVKTGIFGNKNKCELLLIRDVHVLETQKESSSTSKSSRAEWGTSGIVLQLRCRAKRHRKQL